MVLAPDFEKHSNQTRDILKKAPFQLKYKRNLLKLNFDKIIVHFALINSKTNS